MHKLFNTNAHLGYRTATSNFQPYLYGFRNKIAIIDLDNTLFSLRRVCSIIQIIIRSKGHLLFVNTNPDLNSIVRQTAERTGQSFINHKWIGGLLTNWNHMQNVHRHFKMFSKEHSQQANSNKNNYYGENSQTMFTMQNAQLSSPSFQPRPIVNELQSFPRYQKMQKCFEGIVTQERPDCIIVFNANQNQKAIEEANRLQIPIICLVDSNVSNNLQNKITYPIPANADSLQFIYLLCNSILKSVTSLFGQSTFKGPNASER
jgi:small subunit ribosomal protein S2